ncbi:MAG TPA: 3'(2'),5'-bisphosphate nucleotidase CysQ [Cellvibrionaceae bacterium]
MPAKVGELARAAGDAMMTTFNNRAFLVDHKADQSPVTSADQAAHNCIVSALPALLDIPILSEEGAQLDFAERRHWARYWLIDPLDGTREFIQGRPEFTVNIALIEGGRPLLGAVYCPPEARLYVGNQVRHWGPIGAFLCSGERWHLLSGGAFDSGRGVRLVTGHRQDSEQQQQLMVALSAWRLPVVSERLGSSFKLCALAEGRFDFYPRLGPTNEWDIAAGQAVLEAAGGAVLNAETLQPLDYNQRETLLNPPFWALADWRRASREKWQQLHDRLAVSYNPQ